MQRLHLVGFTSELDGLIFSASSGARSGGYVVALDAALMNAIRDVLARRDAARTPLPGVAPRPADPFRSGPGAGGSAAAPRQGSGLAPRAIQARLRAGRSIGEVALEAGVDEEWVRRFASPVFAEQAHIVGRALKVVFVADGTGPSAEPLQDSVATNLVARGVLLTPDEQASGWSAFQMRDTAWVVQFRTTVGLDEVIARWGFDVRAATLVALNRAAAELGWVSAGHAGRSAFASVDEGVGQSLADVGVTDGRSAGTATGTIADALPPIPPSPQRPRAVRKPRPSGGDREPEPPSGEQAAITAEAAAKPVPRAQGVSTHAAGADATAGAACGPSPGAARRRRSEAGAIGDDGQAALPLTEVLPGAASRVAPGARRRAAPAE